MKSDQDAIFVILLMAIIIGAQIGAYLWEAINA